MDTRRCAWPLSAASREQEGGDGANAQFGTLMRRFWIPAARRWRGSSRWSRSPYKARETTAGMTTATRRDNNILSWEPAPLRERKMLRRFAFSVVVIFAGLVVACDQPQKSSEEPPSKETPAPVAEPAAPSPEESAPPVATPPVEEPVAAPEEPAPAEEGPAPTAEPKETPAPVAEPAAPSPEESAPPVATPPWRSQSQRRKSQLPRRRDPLPPPSRKHPPPSLNRRLPKRLSHPRTKSPIRRGHSRSILMNPPKRPKAQHPRERQARQRRNSIRLGLSRFTLTDRRTKGFGPKRLCGP